MKPSTVLPTVCFLFLTGCAINPHMVKPSKPSLNLTDNPADPRGICLSGEDTRELLKYIYRLEDGYADQ